MKNQDWIYRKINSNPELEKTLEKVEKALGFKLFIWQKIFIERGTFRQYGETTARILKDLLETDKEPIDYSDRPGSGIADFYRRETRDIKEKLDNAGIQTRVVFFSKEDKKRYIERNSTWK